MTEPDALARFKAVLMLDSHDGKIELQYPAVLSLLDAEGAERRREFVAIPLWARMQRFEGRGEVPTLCLCRTVDMDSSPGTRITTTDCLTLTGDEMEQLYAVGRVERPRWTVELVER